MSTRRKHNRLDKVQNQTGESDNVRRRIVQLLPEDYPKEPDPPNLWKEEVAMRAWINGLSESHEVIVMNIVNAPSD